MDVYWKQLIDHLHVADVVDVLVVALLIYVVLKWLGRRASHASVLAGAFVVFLYVAARYFDLYLTRLLFQVGLPALLAGLVIVFQNDLRRGFERLSAWRPFQKDLPEAQLSRMIDVLIESAQSLAERKIGALIVLQGREPLERHTRGGVAVHAELSIPLLHSIFHPKSMGHDGAVVIADRRIERLGVHLPLSSNLEEVGNAGTRHTAALGLAERCDALVLVVSEERGSISLAEQGQLVGIDDSGDAVLRGRLEDFYQDRFPPPSRRRWVRLLTQDPLLRLASLSMAALLWHSLVFRVETLQRSLEGVPVELRNLPENWLITESTPSEVRLKVTGPERSFSDLEPDSLRVTFDLSKVTKGYQNLPITNELLNLPDELTLQEARPAAIAIRATPGAIVERPVKVRLSGKLPMPLVLGQTRVEPPTVRLLVPVDQVTQFDEIQTEPIALNTLNKTETLPIALILPENSQFAQGQVKEAQVTIEVKPPQASPKAEKK